MQGNMENEVRIDSRRELLSPLPDVESVVITTELPSWRLDITEFQIPNPARSSNHSFFCLNPTRRKSLNFFLSFHIIHSYIKAY